MTNDTPVPVASPTGSESDYSRKVAKLLLILGCYVGLFYTLVGSARWFLIDFVKEPGLTHLFDWFRCLPGCPPSESEVLRTLSYDSILFFLFMAQHSLFAERNLVGTFIHQKFFIDWKVNGALYTLATAASLHFIMCFWKTVPVYLWNCPSVKPVLGYVHLSAWMILYGTTLMQDLPELIGLNQVIFSNASTSRKSPEFKAMLKQQRHIGLIPFFIITVTCEIMTLDRVLFLLILLVYSYSMWRDPTSLHYIKSMMESKRSRLDDFSNIDMKAK